MLVTTTSVGVLILASAVEEYLGDEIGKSCASPAKSSLASKLPLGSFSIFFFSFSYMCLFLKKFHSAGIFLVSRLL